MELPHFDLNEWITIILIIAQAGVVYYRLKRVEQKTENFNQLFIEFAVHKKELEHQKKDFERHSSRIESSISKIDSRISNMEAYALNSLSKNRQNK